MGSKPSSQISSASSSAQTRTTNATKFQQISEDQLEAHMEVFRYGTFDLTEAIRPSIELSILPRQGFRHDTYIDPTSKNKVPVIMAAASSERLFDLFIDMISTLGPVVDVVLETSHYRHNGGHEDFYREHIDMPVLKSILYDYESMLLNDGCTGIAVLNPQRQQEVQFDEHKMIIAYGSPLENYERVLISHDVYCESDLRFLTEAEHVHSSSDALYTQFESLCSRLGMDSESEDDAEFA
ncbi:MAG: hypothetical protein IT423_11120 [Pirellulaceae bacterium]|nr:hypothetical protein [Pirellulaceae bacterium]